MFTQIITFLIFFAVVGCILYGRKLIKTEKVDAVFGNPERAKGGIHWVIVGSSFILLTWLYYSWDIAKAFYPKAANELCQVGKVNDSLLSLKYLFPIEERQFKSTFVIKSENKNIDKLAKEIENTTGLRNQDKNKLLKLIVKTKNTIPLLTNEKLLENENKIKIKELTNKITQLTKEFKKTSYPKETVEEKSKRITPIKGIKSLLLLRAIKFIFVSIVFIVNRLLLVNSLALFEVRPSLIITILNRNASKFIVLNNL